jgi:hypothetical protein
MVVSVQVILCVARLETFLWLSLRIRTYSYDKGYYESIILHPYSGQIQDNNHPYIYIYRKIDLGPAKSGGTLRFTIGFINADLIPKFLYILYLGCDGHHS